MINLFIYIIINIIESNTLSLNKEFNGKNPKEISFNYKYYFY